jgi:hypothetical protein
VNLILEQAVLFAFTVFLYLRTEFTVKLLRKLGVLKSLLYFYFILVIQFFISEDRGNYQIIKEISVLKLLIYFNYFILVIHVEFNLHN